jgi:gamma-glutamylaminecyclotransferase
MLLFVYGTLKRGCKNHYILEDCQLRGQATLLGYSMLDVGGFPCIIPGPPNDAVKGEIYEIPPGRWPRLDRLERVPHLYTRETVNLLDGAEVQVYIWNSSTHEMPPVPDGIWRE